MAKWNLSKAERKAHDGGVETIAYEATIHLDAEAEPMTLGDIAALIQNLVDVDGIPVTAVLGNTLDAALRWTDADLEP